MTFLEFLPYFNNHVRLKLTDEKELSGVIIGSINQPMRKDVQTVYSFIPTKNMVEWKLAEKQNNKKRMKSLQKDVDIKNIVWAERIKY